MLQLAKVKGCFPNLCVALDSVMNVVLHTLFFE